MFPFLVVSILDSLFFEIFKTTLNNFVITLTVVCLEPTSGLEPLTYSLPWSCSTTELSGQICREQDSNLRRPSGRQFYRLMRLSTPPSLHIWLPANLTDNNCPITSLEPSDGFEPTTCCLQNSCSTTELRRQFVRKAIIHKKKAGVNQHSPAFFWV